MGFLNTGSVVVVVLALSAYAIRYYNVGCYCNEQVDLSNKVFIVTGGHSGLGYETTRGLAKRGATIYIGCKDVDKAQTSVSTIKREFPGATIKVLALDLSSLASVRQFAQNFLGEKVPLHGLILNAGTWKGQERTFTSDGFEATLQVNHLSHFLLSNLLTDVLKSSAPSRVISVSALLHELGTVNLDDLNLDKDYDPLYAYSNTKLMNILFSNELGRRLAGTGVVTSSLHPGVIVTQLHRHTDYLSLGALYEAIWGFLGKNPEYGAQTTLTAAISPKFANKTSIYLSECQEAEVSATAQDKELAKKLWEVSAHLTGLE